MKQALKFCCCFFVRLSNAHSTCPPSPTPTPSSLHPLHSCISRLESFASSMCSSLKCLCPRQLLYLFKITPEWYWTVKVKKQQNCLIFLKWEQLFVVTCKVFCVCVLLFFYPLLSSALFTTDKQRTANKTIFNCISVTTFVILMSLHFIRC